MPLSLPIPVLGTLAGLYGLLGVASAIALGLHRLSPNRDFSELMLRTRSWWLMLTVFSVALALNRAGSILFFACLSFFALREYLSLIPTRHSDRHVLFWAYVAIALQYLWVYLGWYDMFLLFIPIGMFLFLPMRMVLTGETRGFINAIGTLQWGLMLTVYTLSHLPYLLTISPSINPVAGGIGLLVYLVLLTEMNDIAQYCWGKCCGHHPLIPHISPGKTRAGLVGGVATTTTAAVLLASWLTPFLWHHALFLGVLLGLAGFIGDVTLSALKRDLDIKDSGTLIPGHGGILDRIDSLIYTAPIFFHFTLHLYGGGVL